MVLGIETAGDRGGIALLSSRGVHELVVPLGRAGGGIVPAAVDALLSLARADREGIELIAVDIGPGSFTGLRIGLAFAKGMAQSLGIPMVGVRQTEAVARPLSWWPGKVAVWIHDRREFVYMAWATPDRVGMEAVLPWREALAKVSEEPSALLVGSGAVRFRAEVAAAGRRIACASEAFAHPRPGEIARLGWARFRTRGADDLGEIEPHYVHKED
ncbi:MAG TPA: tRNA (adenosine(37)-N6)-threonylcarbamoyltransferase complex dimerization subunit type 1 TsaB [Candidatus Acetothermia bacterium]|mgnify:CR=1 FL=1|nr:tRNA (adenosine(37)-N6)-threonylcarbamoyltransferase complex dimerization subunit type 1 TsaB [Candidatus Acetothermia bacterium]